MIKRTSQKPAPITNTSALFSNLGLLRGNSNLNADGNGNGLPRKNIMDSLRQNNSIVYLNNKVESRDQKTIGNPLGNPSSIFINNLNQFNKVSTAISGIANAPYLPQ